MTDRPAPSYFAPRARRLLLGALAVAALAGCSVLQAIDPTIPRTATPPAAPVVAAPPALPGQPAMCIKEGAACNARSAACCGGLICVGSAVRDGMCVTRN
jgi:hypothetical protein